MGEVRFKSPGVTIPAGKKDVFEFISDLRNFEGLMPDQVEKWEADRDHCEFTIKGLSTFNMKITDRTEDKVILESGDKAPVDFVLACELGGDEKGSTASIELVAELSPMIKMMASRPLQNLVNIMAEKLEGHFSG
jgi:hypothetical protein